MKTQEVLAWQAVLIQTDGGPNGGNPKIISKKTNIFGSQQESLDWQKGLENDDLIRKAFGVKGELNRFTKIVISLVLIPDKRYSTAKGSPRQLLKVFERGIRAHPAMSLTQGYVSAFVFTPQQLQEFVSDISTTIFKRTATPHIDQAIDYLLPKSAKCSPW